MRPHISINVRNVHASVQFYRRLFGVAPQKQTDTYAKFDLEKPALNLALLSSAKGVSTVNHFGIEVDSPKEVGKWQEHLREQGLLDAVEEGVQCCYALQDKVWATDPDGNHWEVFTVLEQLPLTPASKGGSCYVAACCSP